MSRNALTIVTMIAASLLASADADAADARSLEFFESKVRPILAEHCYECHGPNRQKSGLRLDHIDLILKGGDNGPAIVRHKPDASRLIEAVGYENIELQMPPKSGKLSDAEIATLVEWVKLGAPWPNEPIPAGHAEEAFDIDQRKKEHWSWSPVRNPPVPAAGANAPAGWPTNAIDRFILANLAEKGLRPQPIADRRTLVRRLYFDITGLPPTPEEVEAFVSDDDPKAYEKLVDRLLASPRFGERWARHWMDLVRYAESRGHEFDFDAPNAYQYRDYLIRAFNADVPYDRFVTEHIAGDIVPNPRRHLTAGFNESILGTGFWYLGEWVHSPVDIRKDETDRFDNMVDVMTKTFLGLTVACARCHDHKFDAISTADYYALFGFLQSTSYRQARFDTIDHNRAVAQRLDALHAKHGATLKRAVADAMRPTLAKADAYLAAAAQAWTTEPERDFVETPERKGVHPDILFDDFESGALDNNRWTAKGKVFSKGAVGGTLPRQQKVSGFLGKRLINTYVGGDNATGVATSEPFVVERKYVRFLIGGGAHKGQTCLNLLVDGKVVRTATGANNEKLDWKAWDVSDLIGRRARLQIVDRRKGGWGHVNVDHIVFTSDADAPILAGEAKKAGPPAAHIAAIAQQRGLDAARLRAWVTALGAAVDDERDPLHTYAVAVIKRKGDVASVADELTRRWRDLDDALARAFEETNATVVVDYAKVTPASDAWSQDGSAYGVRPMRPGDLQLSDDPSRPIAGVYSDGVAVRHPAWSKLKWAPGVEKDPGSLGGFQRYGQTLRTPTFELTTGRVYYLVRGRGVAFNAVDSHRVIKGPLHGNLVARFDTKGEWQWVSKHLPRYVGHRMHVEFVPEGNGPFEVRMVVVADSNPVDKTRRVVDPPNRKLRQLMASPAVKSADALAKGYRDLLLDVAQSFASRDLGNDGDAAGLADWLVRNSVLFYGDDDARGRAIQQSSKPVVDRRRAVLAELRLESRLAPATLEGDAEDEHVLIRGNSNTPGDIVHRRLLEGIGGAGQPRIQSGSGRLDLVRRMLDEDNPYISRVMVNRIWHHLFGRGIVPSVDNLGVLGQQPTHPELLDWLAHHFRHDAKWSVKHMIKLMVTSSAYRQSSKPVDAVAERGDPANDLLHRMRVRRLQGEAIRDAVLAISGRLDDKMYGPSVPVHLTSFMTGRGRPKGGPLDGAGRRSVYVAVRRNFLSPMMLAFDTPIPFNTIGKRTASNVPAQALILMNDPFIVQQAEVWAKRVIGAGGSAEQRIERMYTQAFARPPSQSELTDALGFIHDQAKTHNTNPNDPRVWTDFAHVLMNVKEFIFIN